MRGPPLKQRHLPLDLVFIPPVVGVEEGNVVAGGRRDARVSRCRQALPVLKDEANQRRFSCWRFRIPSVSGPEPSSTMIISRIRSIAV